MYYKYYLLIFIFVKLFYGYHCMYNLKWNYKYSYTKNLNQQLAINCGNNEQIWIGWSHYGTKTSPQQTTSTSTTGQPNNSDFLSKITYQQQQQKTPFILDENDCWMNFTEKIAEQCNGVSQCDISSQPTYIHKCGKISDYIYVSYICINSNDTFDICKDVNIERNIINEPFYISTPDFPDEYPPLVDCTCQIKLNMNFKFEVLWFSLQDNDYLIMQNNINLSGWMNPTNEIIIDSNSNNNIHNSIKAIKNDVTANIRFTSDDSLAYKGFWLKTLVSKSCKDGWQLVGDKCIKVFSEALDWRSASKKCESMNSYLVRIGDVVADLKLTNYMKRYYPDVQSYWIGLRKYIDDTNNEKWMWQNSIVYNDSSWWPWRKLSDQKQSHLNHDSNNCVAKRKNEDGFFTVPCDLSNKLSFICQSDDSYEIPDVTVKVRCGETKQFYGMTNNEQMDDDKLSKPLPDAIIPIERQTDTQMTTTTETTTISTSTKSFESNEPLTTIKTDKISLVISLDENYEILLPSSSSSSSTFDNKKLFPLIQNASPHTTIKQLEIKYNTTIIAGIITGVGVVILVLNVLILFICRRNLKKLIKNAKQAHPHQIDDITQEYFDSYTGPVHHHLHRVPVNGSSTSSSSDGSAIFNQNKQIIDHVESAQLFTARDLLIRQSNSSAFRAFELQQQQLHQQQQQQEQQYSEDQQQNQYDKMNHQIPFTKLKALQQNDPNQNYAHTYECVDPIDMPCKRTNTIHLGVSSRNYKTTNGQQPISNDNFFINQLSSNNVLLNFQYPNTSLDMNQHNSNSTSLSSNSSTSHLIKPKPQLFNTNITPNDSANLSNSININGSWSPDSAYYSSIPGSSHCNYMPHLNHHHFHNNTKQQSQIPSTNLSFGYNHDLNDSLKSQFV